MKKKLIKWYYNSLVDDFYKGNNTMLGINIIFIFSVIVGYGYLYSGIIILFISIYLGECYFKKGRRIFLLLYKEGVIGDYKELVILNYKERLGKTKNT